VATIMVVDDEECYREPLAFNLRRDGFEVLLAADGETALALMGAHDVDLVLLDLMLPGIPGAEVCRRLRRDRDVPVIMVTARTSVADRVAGLELGADDYVTKPYSYRELVARVRAVLRGHATVALPTPEYLDVSGISLSVSRHQASVDGVGLTLPPREFDLLEYFLRHAGRLLTRDQILQAVWGPEYGGEIRTIDVHVRRLRAKIEADPAHPSRIVTVRDVGYRLVADPPSLIGRSRTRTGADRSAVGR